MEPSDILVDGDEIEVNAFGLYFSFEQRLQIIVLVAGNREF